MTFRKRESLLPSIFRNKSFFRRHPPEGFPKPILSGPLGESPSSPPSNTEVPTAAQSNFDGRDDSGIAHPSETPGPPVPAKNTPPMSPKKVAFKGVHDENVYIYDAEALIRGLKASWAVHTARVAAEMYPRSTPMLLSPTAVFVQKKLEEAILSVEGCRGTKVKLLDVLMEKVVRRVPVRERGKGLEEWVEDVLRDALGALSGENWMESWEDKDLRSAFAEEGEIARLNEAQVKTATVNRVGDEEADERSLHWE